MPANDKTALVILAAGAEEMEVSIIVDVLRRGAVKVTLAGLGGGGAVICSRGLRLVPDVALGDVAGNFDVVVLPGGAQGAENLASSPLVGRHLKNQWQRGGLVAASCAAPYPPVPVPGSHRRSSPRWCREDDTVRTITATSPTAMGDSANRVRRRARIISSSIRPTGPVAAYRGTITNEVRPAPVRADTSCNTLTGSGSSASSEG